MNSIAYEMVINLSPASKKTSILDGLEFCTGHCWLHNYYRTLGRSRRIPSRILSAAEGGLDSEAGAGHGADKACGARWKGRSSNTRRNAGRRKSDNPQATKETSPGGWGLGGAFEAKEIR